MNLHAWLWILSSAAFEALADLLLKMSHAHDSNRLLWSALAAYVVTMALWIMGSRSAHAIAVPGAIWLLLSLILTTFIGVGFGEHLDQGQWAGLAFAVVAVILISI